MARLNTQTYRGKIKAVHRYKVVGNITGLTVSGKRFHFIGAGGVGMNGLAKLLIKNKAIVTGSDQTQSAAIEALCRMGADIKIGHNAANLGPQIDAVVYSAAVKEENPELKLARQRGCKLYKYAQMLGRLCNNYDGIAVAGTHGKSTTAGWLIHLLKQAGINTNFIIGAGITQLGMSSASGNSNYFVAEACEYDQSFLNLNPKIACILNIETDHLDYYKNEQQIVEAFGRFALGTRRNGIVIANGADLNVAKVIRKLRADLLCQSFGFDKDCNFSAQNVQLIDGLYAFDVYHNGRLLGRTRISLPGEHNILNALAVVAMAADVGVENERILELLPSFTGIDRRLMLKEKIDQITVLDDYAHHPTEIKAALKAIRQRYQPRRLWCVFQPHQYSRTRFLLDDFAESFKLADVTIVPEIYFVRDSISDKNDINAQVLVERMCDNGTEALFIDSFAGICSHLKKNVTPGDVVVTMGAGDIWKVADEYIRWLGTNR